MTGRQAGYCAGFEVPGYMNPAPGRGMGFGRGWGRGGGRGRGWRHRNWWHYGTAAPGPVPVGWDPPVAAPAYYAPPSAQQQAQALKAQAEHLEQALNDIRNRLDELETTESKGN